MNLPMNTPRAQALARVDVLMELAIAGRLDAVHDQLANGVDPRAGEAGGTTVLHLLLSARTPHRTEDVVRTTQALLDAGVPVNARNLLHVQPLHVAAEFHPWPVVQTLLERGADPWARDGEGHRPVDLAHRNLAHGGIVDGLNAWCAGRPDPYRRPAWHRSNG